MMHGKRSQIFLRIPKRFIKTCVWLLIIASCLLFYWWLIAPTISRFFSVERSVYKGVEYYCNNTYLNFDDGKDFKVMLSSLHIPKNSQIIDFYYVDNKGEDNPIYGKMCDIYALDVLLQPDEYKEHKTAICDISATHKSRGDFISYALTYDPSFKKVVVASFCDQSYIVRYIMITEFDTVDGFDQVIGSHSNLDWNVYP